MCGIAGVVALGGRPLPVGAESAVRVALAKMRHRGPDGLGVDVGSRFVLGHARLSIVDIEGGSQPFRDDPTGSSIVYNGEVYGYRLLRDSLASERPLASRSDTEVILRQLTRRGWQGLREMNGMYAFCAVLPGFGVLLISRDPIGIKPLYIVHGDGWIGFSSELRAAVALMRALGLRPAIRRKAVAEYLRFGWIRAPGSLISGVDKLGPGESVSVSDSGTVRTDRIAVPAPSACEPRNVSDHFLLDVLGQVVRDQLVADVPVGLFLSGGIDSSLVLALASRERPGIQTFSVGFSRLAEQAGLYDESAQARRVSELFGSQHQEIQLDASRVRDEIDAIVESVDEPISDPAVIPLFFLSRLARAHVKVCLTGDGGDELFGGYRHHMFRAWRQWASAYPALGVRLRRIAGNAQATRFGQRHLRKANVLANLLFDTRLVPELVPAGSWPSKLSVCAPAEAPVPWHDPDSLLLFELAGPLAAGMLHKTDRVTMFHSLEARVPLLDNRVIALARATPWNSKVRGFTTKWLLREALRSVSPQDIWSGRKRGFRVPLGNWFHLELGDWVRGKLLGSAGMDEVLGADWTRDIVASHEAKTRDFGDVLWALAVLQPWLDEIGYVSVD